MTEEQVKVMTQEDLDDLWAKLKSWFVKGSSGVTDGAAVAFDGASGRLLKPLGYTPFNSANFTKANIKSTLGISDWALAASKPSYAFSEITGTVTNAQLAGSIANNKLANSSISIAGTSVSLGGSISTATLKSNLGLGASAYVGYDTEVTQNSTKLITSGAVYNAIDNLPEPMIMKGTLGTNGTITSLPTASASNEGFTYKVITAGTYASQAAKVGDVFVSCKPVGASAYEWILIPAGDTDSDTWRNIKVNGTQLLGTAISSGAVNFKNGGNITLTGSGNDITLGVASGYAIPTTAKQGNWDTAYGWGNHASAGYALASNLGTASTHAHGDYATGMSWDSTNNKLAWSKGGTAQTAITIGYATNANYAEGAYSTPRLASANNADGLENAVFNANIFQYGVVTSDVAGSELRTSGVDAYGQASYINIPWTNANFGGQIFVGANSGNQNDLGFRTRHGGTWGVIRIISHSGNSSVSKSGETLTVKINGTEQSLTNTNTHRPIQLNGTEILGNNTTALNLKAGTGVSLTNSNGTVTFDNSGVRAATINGNYLRINTNGTNADLTIPFATNANFANATHKINAQISFNVGASGNNKYRKIGTITITGRYTHTIGTLQYYSGLSTTNNYASAGFLYINAYQQDALGKSAVVTFEQLGDTKRFKFYAVEQVSSTSTVIDIYVTIEDRYHGIFIAQISGDLPLSDGGSWLDELPEGTRTIVPSFTARVGYADKLTTARSINGTSFDGTANITTANWGTARNISIADSDSTNTGTAVSVNGSAAVTLKLPATIKATLSGNASSATKATQDGDGNTISSTYLKLSGGTLTGDIRTASFWSGTDSLGSYIEGNSDKGVRIQYPKTISGSSRSHYDQLVLQNGVLKWNNNTVWHAGNDGSGSGLDADLLDGQHGSYYAVKAASKGSTTKPIYTDANGAFQECSTYAGGTAVTLNGSSKAANTASFYAPTGAGSNGNILQSTGGTPSWVAQSTLVAGKATILETARTLWGRSFNGSSNISGNIENAGDITPSANDSKNIGSSSLQFTYIYGKTLATSSTNGLSYCASNGKHRWYANLSPDASYKQMELDANSNLTVQGDVQGMGGVSAMGIASMAINSMSGISFASQIAMNGQTYNATSGLITLPNFTDAYNPSGTGSTTQALSQKGAKALYTTLNNAIPATATIAGWGYKKGMVYSTSTASDSGIQVATGADPTYQYITNTSQSSLVITVTTDNAAANSYGVHRYIMIYNNRSSATLVQFADQGQGVVGPADNVSIPANSYMEFSIIHPASNAKCMVTWSMPLKNVSTM